jgi:hypothetical protein
MRLSARLAVVGAAATAALFASAVPSSAAVSDPVRPARFWVVGPFETKAECLKSQREWDIYYDIDQPCWKNTYSWWFDASD